MIQMITNKRLLVMDLACPEFNKLSEMDFLKSRNYYYLKFFVIQLQ